MKNKITETLEGSLYPWSERDTNYFAQEILDLLKEEGWLSPEEIAKEKMGNTLVINEYLDEEYRKKGWKSPDDTPTCYEKGCVSWGAQGNEKDLRAKGWLHKDDPVKGLKAERECERKPDRWKIGYVTQETTPLTVGEVLEMFDGLLQIAKRVCKTGCINRATPTDEPLWACKDCWVGKHLVTKDGGKIVKEEK